MITFSRLALLFSLMLAGCSKFGKVGELMFSDQGAAPVALSVFAPLSIDAGSTKLNWSMSSGIGVQTALTGLSYQIEYAKNSFLLTSTTVRNVVPPYVLSGLDPGTQYFYQVKAIGSGGVVGISEVLSFTTVVPAPGIPAITLLTPSETSIRVDFTAGTGALNHDLLYSTSALFASPTLMTGISSGYLLQGLNSGSIYYLKVRATNSGGFSDSAPVSTVSTLIPAPLAPTVVSVTPLQNSVTVVYTSAPTTFPTTYSLTYGTQSQLVGATVVSNQSSPIVLGGLNANTIYYYKLTSTNSRTSTSSAIQSFTTTSVLSGAPTNLTSSSVTSSGAILSWAAPSGMAAVPDHYRVRYSVSASYPISSTVVLDPAVSGLRITGLLADTIYNYQVIAVYTNPAQELATSSTFKTSVAAPGAPVNLVATPSVNSVSATWSAGVGGVANYKAVLVDAAGTSQAIEPAGSPLVISGLQGNTGYDLTITATNLSGSQSSTVHFTTLTAAPGAVALSFASVTTSGASLSWSGGGGATTFDVKYGLSDGLASGTFTKVTVPATQFSYALSGLFDHRTYYVQVVANNGSGIPTASNQVNIPLPMKTPSAPVASDASAVSATGASLAFTAGATVSQTIFEQTLYPVLKTNCASCHSETSTIYTGTSFHAHSDPSLAHMAMFYVNGAGQQKVNLENPNQSLIYTQLLNAAHPSAMAQYAPSVLSALKSWVSQGAGSGGITTSFSYQLGTSSSLSGTSQVTSVSSPVAASGLTSSQTYYFQIIANNSGGSTLSAPVKSFRTLASGSGLAMPDFDVELRVADRRYVDDVLRSVFGLAPLSSANTGSALIVSQNIWERSEFGGACDRLAQVLTGKDSNYIPTVSNYAENCFNGLGSVNPSQLNQSRLALIAKTCDSLVSDSAAMGVVMTKVFNSTNAGAVDDAHLITSYQLFYPGETPSPTVLAKLKLLGTSNVTDNTSNPTSAAQWKLILYGICSSPGWQTAY